MKSNNIENEIKEALIEIELAEQKVVSLRDDIEYRVLNGVPNLMNAFRSKYNISQRMSMSEILISIENDNALKKLLLEMSDDYLHTDAMQQDYLIFSLVVLSKENDLTNLRLRSQLLGIGFDKIGDIDER